MFWMMDIDDGTMFGCSAQRVSFHGCAHVDVVPDDAGRTLAEGSEEAVTRAEELKLTRDIERRNVEEMQRDHQEAQRALELRLPESLAREQATHRSREES